KLLRIEPDAYAIIALAKDVNVRNAIHAQQLVAKIDVGVIAQVQVVIAAVRRNHADDQQDVRRLFADRDTLSLNLGWQFWQSQGYTVLHHHQGRVQACANLKGDRQRIRTVVAGLRRHVQHVLDAVDLFLDGSGHRIGDNLGAGSGIVDRYLDRGRRNLGV